MKMKILVLDNIYDKAMKHINVQLFVQHDAAAYRTVSTDNLLLLHVRASLFVKCNYFNLAVFKTHL